MKVGVYLGGLVLALAACSSPPKPLLPPLPSPGPFKAIRKAAGVNPVNVTIPWLYPAGINASNYCWVLQTSSNLSNWIDAPGCQTGTITVAASNSAAFFRLKGTPF